MAFSDLKAAEDETVTKTKINKFTKIIVQLIAQLRSENQVLRNLLHGSSLPLPIINTDQSCTDGTSNSSDKTDTGTNAVVDSTPKQT